MPLPTPSAPLKIGTRGSPLALAQAQEARDLLAAVHDLPQGAFRIVVIKVIGDAIQERALKEIGGKGLFTREIEEELLAGKIDIAVHSTKDMPTEQPPGLVLDAFLPREDVRDAFLSDTCTNIAALPRGAVVGTSSIRRRAQLLVKRPDLQVVGFRGNVQTRLKKLQDGIATATFLACAGLNRLGLDTLPAHPISPDDMLPAVAQGAIGIERRIDDAATADLLAAIHDTRTGELIAAERAFLRTFDGSCETPIAALAERQGGMIRLRGEVLRPDGSEAIPDDRTAPIADGPHLGEAMARDLLSRAGPGFFDQDLCVMARCRNTNRLG